MLGLRRGGVPRRAKTRARKARVWTSFASSATECITPPAARAKATSTREDSCSRSPRRKPTKWEWSRAASAWLLIRARILPRKSAERAAQFVRQRSLGERLAIDADQHNLKICDARAARVVDVEPERHRRRPQLLHVRVKAQPLVQECRRMEIGGKVHPRQPAVKPVEDLSVRHAGGTKQLGFGHLDETDEGAVADDAGGIDVAPANVLLDGERRACFAGVRAHTSSKRAVKWRKGGDCQTIFRPRMCARRS